MTPNPQGEEAPSDEVFTNHFVLYLDFLGVSQAATTWAEDRARNLIAVLQTIAAARAQYAIGGESLPDGSYNIKATAETSTFSDHIVASYPLFAETDLPIDFFMDMHLKLVQDMVTKIAIAALNVGLLVRGGVTIGKLFHSDGVVFGEAMIDAYRLESRVAIYPRVVVPSRIYSKLGGNSGGRLIQDSDGIWHLNYFANMVASIDATARNEWLADRMEMIKRNILNLHTREKWNEFAKWSWFKEKLSAQIH